MNQKTQKIRSILFLLFVNFLIFTKLKAQFTNDWINNNQNYIKITIEKNGIYRLSKKEIEQAGFDLKTVDPRNIQMYYRAKPYRIYIAGENDGRFDDSDYIEFYAAANDGKQDEELYRPKSARTNVNLSMFGNEAAYFITVTSSNGIRTETTNQKLNLLPQKYFLTTIKKTFSDDWNHDITTGGTPSLLQSFFDPNESLVSARYRLSAEPNKFLENISLKNFYSDIKGLSSFYIQIGSRNYPSKELKVDIAGNTKTLKLNDFIVKELTFENLNLTTENVNLETSFLSSTSNIIVNNKPQDAFSILSYSLKYPTKPIFSENNEYELIPNLEGNSLLKLSGGNKEITGYDISDIYNQRKLKIQFDEQTNESNVFVENTTNGSKIWLSSRPLSPKKIDKIEFSKIDYSAINYVIITDSSLLKGANEYKKYRESIEGGSYNVLIVEKHKLNNEFSFGERNPIAIHRFSDFMLKNSKVNNLLLLGKALSFPTLSIKNPEFDLVPSWGYPASDVLLTSGLNGKHIDVPAIPTGRVSATNNQEILDYLDKVKSFEANKNSNNWNKKFLQLGGGKGEGQVKEFKTFLEKLGTIAEKSLIGANYQIRNKTKVNDGVEPIDISKEINDGVGMVTFFGHSSSSTLDLDIGFASDEKANFKNGPLFPFMFFNGCGAGNVFNTYTSLSKDWLLAPKKGAIAILAHSFLSFSNSNMDYMEKLYRTWLYSSKNINKSIGEIVQIVAEEQIKENPGDIYTMANVHEMILQGDPALKIFNMDKPDFQTEDEQLFLISTQKNKPIADSDSLKLGVVISNFGIYDAGSKLNLNIKKTFLDGKTTDQTFNIKAIAFQDTVFVNIKKDFNLKYLNVNVDSDSKIDEMDEANNTGSITFNWDALKNSVFYSTATLVDVVNPNLEVKLAGKLPIDGMVVGLGSELEVKLVDENSFGTKTDKLEVSYKKICESCSENTFKIKLGTISGAPNEILTSINLSGLSPGDYEFFVQGYDAKKNPSGEVRSFKIKIIGEPTPISVKVYPNPMTLFTTFEVGLSQAMDGKSNFKINISSQKGILIKTLEGYLTDGLNNVYWDGADNSGSQVAPGNYIYSLQINKNGANEYKSGQIALVR